MDNYFWQLEHGVAESIKDTATKLARLRGYTKSLEAAAKKAPLHIYHAQYELSETLDYVLNNPGIKNWRYFISKLLLYVPKEEIQEILGGDKGMSRVEFKDGTFRKRHKKWEYRFMYKGKQVQVIGWTKWDCWQQRADIEYGKLSIEKVEVKVETFGEYLTAWHPRYKAKKQSAKTYKNNQSRVRDIVESLGDIPLEKLTAEHIQDYLNAFETSNVREKYAYIFSGALRKAHELGKITVNPYKQVEIDKHVPESYPAIEYDHQTIILNAIKDIKYRILFLVCCCTGLRISKALSLRKSDIYFDHKIIRVKTSESRLKGGWVHIPFLPQLFDGIDFDVLGDNDLIFDGLKYGAARLYYERLFAKLNLGQYVRHSFRHTFTSVCFQVGFDLKWIQTTLGHATASVTLNTYTHLIKLGNSQIKEYLTLLLKSLKTP